MHLQGLADAAYYAANRDQCISKSLTQPFRNLMNLEAKLDQRRNAG